MVKVYRIAVRQSESLTSALGQKQTRKSRCSKQPSDGHSAGQLFHESPTMRPAGGLLPYSTVQEFQQALSLRPLPAHNSQ
jgi:hypothetical protein